MRDDRERLLDILEAIERIERYASRGREAFEDEELVQTWVVHYIQIIGEAAARISDDLQKSHAEIPWAEIIGMRNVLVHDYFGIDQDEVWATVADDLPRLKVHVKQIVSELEKDAP